MRTRAALDYETGTRTYSVTVTATDPAGLDDTIEVTITVNNVDEPGTVTLSSLQPIEETPLTATLDDPDDVAWQRDLVVGEFPERGTPPGPPSVGKPQTPIRRLPPM